MQPQVLNEPEFADVSQMTLLANPLFQQLFSLIRTGRYVWPNQPKTTLQNATQLQFFIQSFAAYEILRYAETKGIAAMDYDLDKAIPKKYREWAASLLKDNGYIYEQPYGASRGFKLTDSGKQLLNQYR